MSDGGTTGTPTTIYIIAGEASGDLLGARLMQAIREESGRPVRFYGIGGDRMAAEGLVSLFPYHELSLMGFVEILPFALKLLARVNMAVDDIRLKKPDLVITIDSPGFTGRVVKKLRQENFPARFVHYVAPTVWAYKPERAQKCASLFDHILLLLPFEPPYFARAGLAHTYVGHPVIAEGRPGDRSAFRTKYDISEETRLFCLLPGSRKGEIERHMPIFAQTIALLATCYDDLAITIAVPRHVLPVLQRYFIDCPFRTVIVSSEQDKKDAIAASDLALVKSGTVALEVAQAGVPMVIAYRVHPISAWMMKRMAQTKYVNLVNILLKREVVPEFLQELCTPPLLATAVAGLLENPAQRQEQKEQFQTALSQLLPPGDAPPSRIAARTVLSLLPGAA